MITPVFNGIAYKALNSDLTCLREGFQYSIGKVYTHDGPIVMGHSGFHLCETLMNAVVDCVCFEGDHRYFIVSYDNTPGHFAEEEYYNEGGINEVVTKALCLETEIIVSDPLEMSDIVRQFPSAHMALYVHKFSCSPNADAVVKQLLNAGASVYALDGHFPHVFSNPRLVQLLLEAGLDPYA